MIKLTTAGNLFKLSQFVLKKQISNQILSSNFKLANFNDLARPNWIRNSVELIDSNDSDLVKLMEKDMIIQENFLTESDENSLLAELEPYMKKLRYEFDHWDNAIHGYRETERLNWNEQNAKIIDRVRQAAFERFSSVKKPNLIKFVHILDIHENGYIKPHVDAIRFCGNTIAGLSLLSDCVMRLVNETDKSKVVNILLKRRSLYIMRDKARYDFAHEVLKNEESYFKNEHIQRKRRISVICRNEPDDTENQQ